MRAFGKKILCFSALVCAFYVFYSAVLMPIYARVCSDVLYADGILPSVLEFVTGFIDLLIFSLVFGTFVGTAKMYGVRKAFAVFAIAAAADAVRYTVSYFASGEDLLASFAVPLVFDLAQMLVGVLSATALMRKKNEKISAAVFVPAALVIVAVKVGMRIRYDIFYGAPEDVLDAMWMVFYYASDVLSGVIVLLLSLLFSKAFSKSEA